MTGAPIGLVLDRIADPATGPLVAGSAAALALVMCLPGSGARAGSPPVRRRRAGAVLALSSASVLMADAPGTRLSLLAILAVAAIPVMALVRRRRRTALMAATADKVVESIDMLAGELAAGVPAGRSLARIARSWPALEPVAEAERLGVDLPSAWYAAAASPGAAQLRLVGAAWSASVRTGAELGGVLSSVADGMQRQRRTERLVAGELSSARATARLVAVLPFAVLLVGGSGAGAASWAFLLGTPAGLSCLAVGLAFELAGLWWIELLAERVHR
ncbi:MAG: type II secretion system F family protein [Nocardioides sp.]